LCVHVQQHVSGVRLLRKPVGCGQWLAERLELAAGDDLSGADAEVELR
jgi:hypothetical protein